MRKDNRGLSLVELLVAVMLASIVAGSIGYLLVTSLRMYNHETTDVALQQELQISLNQMVDYAIESQTIVIQTDNSARETEYLGLGTVDGDDLETQVFFHDKTAKKLYLYTGSITGFRSKNLDNEVADLVALAGATPNQYLLAENIVTFYVKFNGDLSTITTESGDEDVYDNPLSLDISLEFERDSTGKHIEKKVADKVTLRNHIKEDIYVNGLPYKCTDNVVALVTENVAMEQRLGVIEIKGENIDPVPKEGLNILEIVPSYNYDYAQYCIGGTKGSLLTDKQNISYGPSAYDSSGNQIYSPVTSAEFEAYTVRLAGINGTYHGSFGTNVNTGSGILFTDGFYPNSGADLYSIVTFPSVERAGYYEYVGYNEGSYAIDDISVTAEPSDNRGEGDSRPRIKGFVDHSYYDYDKEEERQRYTAGKYFDPHFEFCDEARSTSTLYYQANVINDPSVRKDYNEMHKTIRRYNNDGGYWDQPVTYFVYAGAGMGDTAVRFSTDYKETSNSYSFWGGSSGYCYVVSNMDTCMDPDNGSYYAYIDGWDTRSDTNNIVAGFDFNQQIKDVVMYSKYFDGSHNPKSIDFGWVWHEAEVGTDERNDITDGRLVTYIKTVAGGSYSINDRIYLAHHTRYSVKNNELFKLFVMQDVLENYSRDPNNMLDVKNGRYIGSRQTYSQEYSTINNDAIKAWEDAGNKVTLDVRIPGDVSHSDIENADMLIIGVNGDGGFDFAQQWTTAIKGTSGTASYSDSNDIDFARVLEIYEKVIDEKLSIACPSNTISAGGSQGATNIAKLFEMLYCVVNDDIEKADIVGQTVERAKAKKIEKQGETRNYWTEDGNYQSSLANRVMVEGSGRELFTDFIKSMDSRAMSKTLYEGEDPTLKVKTSDIIYIEESGINAGSIIVPERTEDIEGYTFDIPSRMVTKVWGGGGGDTISNFEKNIMICDSNYYLMDVYHAAFDGYEKSGGFTHNTDKNIFYKFRYSAPLEGMYRNQVVWNQTSDLFHLTKSGSSGLLGLQGAKQTTKLTTQPAPDTDQIGFVDFVGADLINDANRGKSLRDLRGDLSDKTYTQAVKQGKVNYSIDVIKLEDGVNKKVIYLTERQFESARRDGLNLYVRITTSKEPNKYNKCYVKYNYNEGGSFRFDYDDKWNERDNDDTHQNVCHYAGVSGVAKETYVREYKYHISNIFFENIAPPYNGTMTTREEDSTVTYEKGNNCFVATIPRGGANDYEGSDELYFYVRDTFDLD